MRRAPASRLGSKPGRGWFDTISARQNGRRVSQLSLLEYAPRLALEEDVPRLYADARSIVDAVGLKTVAFDLDANKSLVEHALAHRNNNKVSLDWAAYLLRKDEPQRLIRSLCDIAGGDFVPREKLTDAQKIARYERALAKLPDAMRRALLEDGQP
jgi:hypothetical protein